jgi:hypothetical protein
MTQRSWRRVLRETPAPQGPKTIFTAFVAVAAAAVVSAQTQSIQIQPQTGGIRVATAVRTDHAPKLDGTLDDPLWQAAPPVDDFRQREPFETQAATERTEVGVLYDTRHIYFGIYCYDDARPASWPPSCCVISLWTWTTTSLS